MRYGKRQAKFGNFTMSEVPKIKIDSDYDLTEIHYHTYNWLPLLDKIVPLFRQKHCPNNSYTSSLMTVAIKSMNYTLNYLTKYKLIKKDAKPLSETLCFKKLWKKWINMGKQNEALCMGIFNALFAFIYSDMYNCKDMIDHCGVTLCHESVEYIMEYLFKNNYLKKNPLKIIGGMEVKSR